MTEQASRVHLVNVATGICFVAIGILLLLERNGMIAMREIVELWPLVLVVVGSAVVWEAMRGGSMKGSGACAGGLFWVVVLGVVLSHAYDRREAAAVTAGPGSINSFTLMSGRRLPHEGTFAGGTVTNVMAGTHIDLRQASIPEGQSVVIDVFNVFGGTEIRVPPGWHVDIQTTAVMGGVNDQRTRTSESADEPAASDAVVSDASTDIVEAGVEAVAPAPTLIIQGVVVMGGVTIK